MYEAIAMGYGLVEIPGVAPPEKYIEHLKKYFKREVLLERIRFGTLGRTKDREAPWLKKQGLEGLLFVLPQKIDDAFGMLMEKADEVGSKRSVILKLGLTMFETMYGRRDAGYLVGLINRETRKKGYHVVYMIHPFLKLHNLVKFLADEVVRFENKDGVLIAWDEKYRSPIFACYLKEEKGGTSLKVMAVS